MIFPSFPQTFPCGVLPIKCNHGKTCPPLSPNVLYLCTSSRATGFVFLSCINKTVYALSHFFFSSRSLIPFPTSFHSLHLKQCPPCLHFCFETVDLALLVGLSPFCYLNVQICLSPTFQNVTRSCCNLFLILTVPTG